MSPTWVTWSAGGARTTSHTHSVTSSGLPTTPPCSGASFTKLCPGRSLWSDRWGANWPERGRGGQGLGQKGQRKTGLFLMHMLI
uniref:Uncharacterized protein n=1 Tax=Anguilla anguilla TaxID=7936 RepID=A0A0E9WYE6_ANGAN